MGGKPSGECTNPRMTRLTYLVVDKDGIYNAFNKDPDLHNVERALLENFKTDEDSIPTDHIRILQQTWRFKAVDGNCYSVLVFVKRETIFSNDTDKYIHIMIAHNSLSAFLSTIVVNVLSSFTVKRKQEGERHEDISPPQVQLHKSRQREAIGGHPKKHTQKTNRAREYEYGLEMLNREDSFGSVDSDPMGWRHANESGRKTQNGLWS